MSRSNPFLDELAKAAFGRTKSEAIKKGICVNCGKPADEFKDELSAREFEISQLCQSCQDSVFEEMEE